jgi:hypothetical protein
VLEDVRVLDELAGEVGVGRLEDGVEVRRGRTDSGPEIRRDLVLQDGS